jgi:hypothetical protein
VHSKTRDHVDLSGIIPIGLGVEVNGLELILLLLIQVAHFSQDFTVAWYLGYQNVVPLQSLSPHTNKLINMCDLVNYFIAVRNDSV